MVAHRLLGRDVLGGAHDHPGLGDGRGAHGLGDAEVGELHLTGGRDEDVARLDVPVHESDRVGGVEGTSGLLEHVERVPERQLTFAGQHVGQGLAHDEFHHQVGQGAAGGGIGDLPVVVHGRDPGVGDPGGDLGLGTEPVHELGVGGELGLEDLDRDPAVEHGVVGLPDLTHAAGGDQSLESIAVGQDRAGIQAHGAPPSSAPITSRPMGAA